MLQFAQSLFLIGQFYPTSAQFHIKKLLQSENAVRAGLINVSKDIQQKVNGHLHS